MSNKQKYDAEFQMSKSYNEASEPQLKALQITYDLIKKHIPEYLTTNNSNHFQISDYGSSEGKNAKILMKFVTKTIKTIKKESSINIYFTDRESNHWSKIFSLLNEKDEDLSLENNVTFSCVGKSFYLQIFPKNSIDFAFSGNSFHWASENFDKKLNPKQMTELARNDWESILKSRSSELKNGGLFICNFVVFDESLKPMYFLAMLSTMMKTMNSLGLLTNEEIDSFFIPVHRRTKKQILDEELLKKYNFQVLSCEIDYFPNPMYEEYKKELSQGVDEKNAASKYATKIVEWNRGYGEFFYDLMLSKRSSNEKKSLLDDLFQRMHDEISKNVENCTVIGHQVYLALKKEEQYSKL
jgi:hypothetical protein